MKNKKGLIFKYTVVILSILNLVWLYGFGYRIPWAAGDPKTEEAAVAASTASEAAVVEEVVEEEPEEEEPEEEKEQVVRCRVTAASRLNVRMGPGTNYQVVTTANYDDILIVLDVENGWVHIRNEQGQEGYVSETYVEIIEE